MTEQRGPTSEQATFRCPLVSASEPLPEVVAACPLNRMLAAARLTAAFHFPPATCYATFGKAKKLFALLSGHEPSSCIQDAQAVPFRLFTPHLAAVSPVARGGTKEQMAAGGSRQRPPVRAQKGVRVAGLARRFSALEHGVLVFC
jgi:hypothetical protein